MKGEKLLCSVSVTHISGLRCVCWVATKVSPSGNLPRYRATIVPERNQNPLLKKSPPLRQVALHENQAGHQREIILQLPRTKSKKVIFPATAAADGSLGTSSGDWQDCSSRSSSTHDPLTAGPWYSRVTGIIKYIFHCPHTRLGPRKWALMNIKGTFFL